MLIKSRLIFSLLASIQATSTFAADNLPQTVQEMIDRSKQEYLHLDTSSPAVAQMSDFVLTLPSMEKSEFDKMMRDALYTYFETGTYQYPVKPGDSKWAELSPAQMFLAAQVPQEILPYLEDNELVNLLEKNPIGWNFTAYPDFEYGFNRVFGQSNVLKELESRENGASALAIAFQQDRTVQSGDLLYQSNEFKNAVLGMALSRRGTVAKLRNNPGLLKAVTKKYAAIVHSEKDMHSFHVAASDTLVKSLLVSNGYLGKAGPDNTTPIEGVATIADNFLKKHGKQHNTQENEVTLSHKEYQTWLLEMLEHLSHTSSDQGI